MHDYWETRPPGFGAAQIQWSSNLAASEQPAENEVRDGRGVEAGDEVVEEDAPAGGGVLDGAGGRGLDDVHGPEGEEGGCERERGAGGGLVEQRKKEERDALARG